MVRKKGYIGLSLIALVVLISALYITLNSRPAYASCGPPDTCCDQEDPCSSFEHGSSDCDGACPAANCFGYLCGRPSGGCGTGYNCEGTWCGDGTCNGGETCSSCQGDCGTCDPCAGVTCTPPADFCNPAGTARRYYTGSFCSPDGSCGDGSCGGAGCCCDVGWYVDDCSTHYPTCVSSTSYYGGICVDGACTHSGSTNCAGTWSDCSGETKRDLSGFCDAVEGTCDSTITDTYDCNLNNNWENIAGTTVQPTVVMVGTTQTYGCCNANTATTCQNQRFNDYSCSSGACYIASQTTTRTLMYNGGTACTTPADFCVNPNTLRDYTGSSCSAGGCLNPFTDVPCQYGCSNGVCNTNTPPVVQPMTYSGQCVAGGTITLNCVASDAQQPANTLSVRGWVGKCTNPSCTTQTWSVPPSGNLMTAPPSGGTFTMSFLIPYAVGDSIAATCQATDNLGSISNWGDARPLCTLGGCLNPPVVTIDSILPNPAKAGTVTIIFTVPDVLTGNPTVIAHRNGGGTNYPATFVSKVGNQYTYTRDVPQSAENGLYDVDITVVRAGDSCPRTQIGQVTVDTIAPVTDIRCNGAACASYYNSAPVSVTFPCTDAACATTRYRVNTGAETTYPPAYSMATTGERNFSYYSIDTAGNVEGAKLKTILYENSAGCVPACTVQEDACQSDAILRRYTAVRCVDGSCIDTYNDIDCKHGCAQIPGPDYCLPNERPVLTSAHAAGTFQNYVRPGGQVTVTSIASDPESEQIRLRCGRTAGLTDLCSGAYATGNPMCTFNEIWGTTGVHTFYCFVEDMSNIRSLRTETLNIVVDNTPPRVSVSGVPTDPILRPGTSYNIVATAADDDSGIKTLTIYVDKNQVATCGGILCTYNFVPGYGQHTYSAVALDQLDNSNTSLGGFAVNEIPNITASISFTGQCITGGQITLQCPVEDPNQPADTLNVSAWAGECQADDCFNTRAWAGGGGIIYLNNGNMTAAPSGVFTRTISITQPSGTGVAATCRVTDEIGEQNDPSEQGDSYPLCIVDGCTNPPQLTITSVIPDPTRAGDIQINFTSSRALVDNPVVTVTPNYGGGARVPYPAVLKSKNGNSYTYNFTVRAEYSDGNALVNVRANAVDNNCPANKVTSVSIDKAPPVVTPYCNLVPCADNTVYSSPLMITLTCSDANGCDILKYGFNSQPNNLYNPLNPPVLQVNGQYTVRYRANDTLGNVDTKQKVVRVYKAPCDPGLPGCTPIEEEARVYVQFSGQPVLNGEPAEGKLFCFLRDRGNLAIRTRDCDIDPTGFGLKIDGVNYFSVVDETPEEFLERRTIDTPNGIPVTIDYYDYEVNRYWELELDTDIFHSIVCSNMTDNQSGIGDEGCGSYVVTNSILKPMIIFPDLDEGVITRTTDGWDAPNFTRGMPIEFRVRPVIQQLLGTSSVCSGANCRVVYSFDYPVYDKLTDWSAFDNAYKPRTQDILSNNFACDQYRTLYTRTTIQSGPDIGMTVDNNTDFFINCEPKLTVSPVEVRYAVGQSAGDVFDVTMWNPTDTAKSFNVVSTTTNPNNYPLQWINFYCPSPTGCTVGPSDDEVQLDVTGDSNTVVVQMPKALKSGSYPVTFMATDVTTSDIYSATGNILIFSEGLEEFQIWQLIGLVGLAAAYLFMVL